MTRALIVCRQSLTRKDSVSLEAQEAEGRAYCEAKGYTVVRVISEESTRGWKADRVGLAEPFAMAARGEYEVLITWDISRAARSVRLLENLIWDLAKHKVRYESVTEAWASDPFYRQIMASVAEDQTRKIGRNVASAVKVRAGQGQTWGRVPLGYSRVNGALTVNVAESTVITEMYRDWIAGSPLRKIAARLITEGIPTHTAPAWSPKTVAWILRNPVYRGDVRLRGLVVAQDAHEAIVSRETWDAAQARFTAPRVRDKPRVASWAEGHVRHSCGNRMHLTLIPRTEPSPTYPHGYPSFRCGHFGTVGRQCTEPRRHLGQPLLEEAIRACLIADLRGALDRPAALRLMRERAGAESTRTERAKLLRRLDDLAAQRREAETLVLTRRRDLAWLDERDREFRATEERIAGQLAALPAVPDEGALATASADMARFRRTIGGLDGPQLGELIALVGEAIVSGEGVMMRYVAPWDALIPSPVMVDPKARR